MFNRLRPFALVTSNVASIVFVLLSFFLADSAQAAGKKKPKATKPGSPTANSPYSPNDQVPQAAGTLVQLDLQGITWPNCDPSSVPPTAAQVYDAFTSLQTKPQCLLNLIASNLRTNLLVKNGVIIIHALIWKSDGPYTPQAGSWGFYRVEKNTSLKQEVDLSGTPYLYGPSQIVLLELNYFSDGFDPDKATFNLQVQTTAQKPQNQANLSTLVDALLKASSASSRALRPTAQALPNFEVWGSVTTVAPTVPAPFSLQITSSLRAASGKTDIVSCDPSPCSFSKTVTVYEPEYWDVSLGLAVPGVLEAKYTTSVTNGVTTYPRSVTRHTDAYAFVDIYPFSRFTTVVNNESEAPHINFGLPITSQSLHRPYVGLAENLFILTKRVKLPIALSVFAGPVFMKQQIFRPATNALAWNHATKMMYGFELPISSIANYKKSSGSKSKGGSSGTGSQ
jgi:hypothetical protein